MTQLTENLTVWELWYFKAVTSYRGERFQVPTRLTTVTRQNGEYKVDLTRHPKFPLVFAVVSHTVLILLLHMTGWPLTYLYMIILHDRVTGTSTLITHDRFSLLLLYNIDIAICSTFIKKKKNMIWLSAHDHLQIPIKIGGSGILSSYIVK